MSAKGGTHRILEVEVLHSALHSPYPPTRPPIFEAHSEGTPLRCPQASSHKCLYIHMVIGEGAVMLCYVMAPPCQRAGGAAQRSAGCPPSAPPPPAAPSSPPACCPGRSPPTQTLSRSLKALPCILKPLLPPACWPRNAPSAPAGLPGWDKSST